MTKWLRRGMVAAVLAGGLATAGASAASGTGSTSGNIGLLNGNQIVLPIQIPVNVCGNAVAVIGIADAHCVGGAKATNSTSGAGGGTSSVNAGALNGNQVNAPIQVPVNVCGNSVAAVLAAATSSCEGGATAKGDGATCSGGTTSGNIGVANGNQVCAPIQVPVNVCGNAVAAILASATASCEGGATAGSSPESGSVTANVACPGGTTSGNALIGNGNQVCAPIQVPVNVCGNAVAVVGAAVANCTSPPPPTTPPPPPTSPPPPPTSPPPPSKPPITSPSLPNTGFSVGLPLGLAAALLIGGSAAVFVGRKRRSSSSI